MSASLKIVIAYADVASALHVPEVADRIARELGESAAELSCWRFDLLGGLEFFEKALTDAARADFVFICGRDRTKYTEGVRRWVAACGESCRKGATVFAEIFRDDDSWSIRTDWPDHQP
jgi:hypothetical protein